MDSEWFLGAEEHLPMYGLVFDTVGNHMRNRQHAIHLKGLAGAKRHTGVATNTRSETPVWMWLDRAVRVADVHRGRTVESDRGRLCVEKVLH